MNEQKMNTFEIVRLIREAPREILGPIETGIMLMMAHIGDRNGRNINAGVRWLIEYTKLSKSSIVRSLALLIKKNVLIVAHDRKRGSHENACYEINIELLEKVRSYRSHIGQNKSSSLKLPRKDKNKDEFFPSSSVTQTPESSVTQTPDNYENISQVVSHRHQVGVTQTPESSVTQTPRTNTPIIKTINDLILVEQKLDAVLSAVEKKSKKSPKQINSWTPQVQEVFKHWQEVLNHKKARLDDDRRKDIVNALKMGFSVEELKKCIDGVKNSAHNMGNNDSGKKYDGLHVIFKNARQVERFISNFDSPEPPMKNNGATALKMSFTERNKKRVNMFSDLEQQLFPEFANRPQMIGNKECLLTFNKEREINER